MIRQALVAVLGHVDHGKTSLLDRIRGSTVAAGEAGGITQHTGATEIPASKIRELCGPALDKLGIALTLPGLLIIDTPGHEAFTTLRKRGGALADIAVLVIDINDGVMPQTVECISILKHTKTPFVVAANKVDVVSNWRPSGQARFLDAFGGQSPQVQEAVDNKLYRLIGQLGQHGFNSERFDRISDFAKTVAIVPLSAKTGEGVSDLLMMLTGLAQKYLEQSLKIDVSGPGKGTILEVKEEKGFGPTLDVILYDGILSKGDRIVMMTKAGPIESRVKGMFKPAPLRESRTTKEYEAVDSVSAAAGVKISGPGAEDVLAGSPLVVVTDDVEKVKAEIAADFESVKIETDSVGAILKADTYGSLEALIAFLRENQIAIRFADVGPVSRRDVMEAEAVRKSDHFLGVVFAFNVEVLPDAKARAEETGIKLFEEPVIYKLADEYAAWKQQALDQQKLVCLEGIPKPAVFRYLPGYTFRQNNPAVFGIEVEEGTLQRAPVMNEAGVRLGTIKEMQNEGETVQSAEKGKRVALSVTGLTLGRQLKEGDLLLVDFTPGQIETLKKHKNLLSESEIEALRRVLSIKRESS